MFSGLEMSLSLQVFSSLHSLQVFKNIRCLYFAGVPWLTTVHYSSVSIFYKCSLVYRWSLVYKYLLVFSVTILQVLTSLQVFPHLQMFIDLQCPCFTCPLVFGVHVSQAGPSLQVFIGFQCS